APVERPELQRPALRQGPAVLPCHEEVAVALRQNLPDLDGQDGLVRVNQVLVGQPREDAPDVEPELQSPAGALPPRGRQGEVERRAHEPGQKPDGDVLRHFAPPFAGENVYTSHSVIYRNRPSCAFVFWKGAQSCPRGRSNCSPCGCSWMTPSRR